MQQVQDENDIVVDTYTIDFVGIFRSIYEAFGGNWRNFVDVLESIWNVYSIIAILLSLVFIVIYIYAKIRMGQLVEIEQAALRDAEARWQARYGQKSSKNERWEAIKTRVGENNPESWRIAIIEADIMLDGILTDAGYVGDSIGDKLKTANPQAFRTLGDAWEAHKVRNEIAHVGSDFVLTKKVAHDTIVRFERVFKEFGAI